MMRKRYIRILPSVSVFGGEFGVYVEKGHTSSRSPLGSFRHTDHILNLEESGDHTFDLKRLTFERKEFEFLSKREWLAAQVVDI